MTDVCVIGAGVAGALAAYELGRAGRSVVLLDAGPRYDDPAALYERVRLDLDPWRWAEPGRDAFTAESELRIGLNGSRVKAVGGTTLAWNAYAPRLMPADLEMRSRFGLGSDWPLSWDELEPWLLRAEAALGVAGGPGPNGPPRSASFPLPAHPWSHSDEAIFRPAFEAHGLSLEPNPMAVNSAPYEDRVRCVSYATCSPLCPTGAKYTAMVHVRRAEATGNVEVRSRSPVRRLRLGGRRRVGRAEYVDVDGSARSVEARAFVLAGGGVEAPRLLLLSAADGPHAAGLGNASGLVGRGLMVHTLSGARARMPERVGGHRIGFGTSICWDLYDHSTLPDVGNVLLFPADLQGPTPGTVARDSGLWGPALAEHVRHEYGHNVKIIGMGEVLPRDANAVTLDPSITDRYGDPVPRLGLHFGDFERRTIDRGLEVGQRLLETAGAEDIWTDRGMFLAHLMGTTRMGRDPARSVCDDAGRCHELDNLWVAGSSLFPTSGSAHPTPTLAALALRTAERVAAHV